MKQTSNILTRIATIALWLAEKAHEPTVLKFRAELLRQELQSYRQPTRRTWAEFIPSRLNSIERMRRGRRIGKMLLEIIVNQRGNLTVTIEERGNG